MSWLHTRLTLNDPPEPADLIVVLAGRMDRKRYGLELFREGMAPRLLLSVGRYEVSKMGTLDFEACDQLIAQRNALPPDQRHFFCEMDAQGVHIAHPSLPRWNTYGEILALRDYLRDRPARRVILISSDVHMRRVELMIGKVFPGESLHFNYCAVRTDEGGYVLKEAMKLAAYQAILRLPDWMIAKLLRLKDSPDSPCGSETHGAVDNRHSPR